MGCVCHCVEREKTPLVEVGVQTTQTPLEPWWPPSITTPQQSQGPEGAPTNTSIRSTEPAQQYLVYQGEQVEIAVPQTQTGWVEIAPHIHVAITGEC